MNHTAMKAMVGAMMLALVLGADAPGELLHHWTLDESDGKQVHSAVSSSGVGVLRNDAKLGAAAMYPALGTAVDLAGGTSGQDIMLAHEQIALGKLTQNFTIVVWFQLDHLAAANSLLSGLNGNHGWSFVVLSNGYLRFQAFDGVGDKPQKVGEAFSRTPLGAGNWYQAAVSVAADQRVKFYVNGGLDDDRDVLAALPTPTDRPFYIGGRGQAFDGASIDGRIADLRVYDEVLSDEQIAALFNEVVPQPK